MAFASDRNGPRDLYIKPSSGATPEEVLFKSEMLFKDPRTWSSDGRFIVLDMNDPKTNRDIFVLPVGSAGDSTLKPYLRTPFQEVNGTVSPDQKWMAYESDESGRMELYVDAFPTPRNKYRVTNEGVGSLSGYGRPFWRKDGKELLIVNLEGHTVVGADVLAGAEFHAGPPHQILALPKGTVAATPTADFSRFLVALPVNESTTSSLTLVLNWQGALKAR